MLLTHLSSGARTGGSSEGAVSRNPVSPHSYNHFFMMYRKSYTIFKFNFLYTDREADGTSP
jgi:hypothetical protein